MLKWMEEYGVTTCVARVVRDVRYAKKVGKPGKDYRWSRYAARPNGRRNAQPLLNKEGDTPDARVAIVAELTRRGLQVVSLRDELQIRWGRGFARIGEDDE